MALVEREAQLAALAAYATEARAGEGRLVFVAGEAGVGKSVLVERFQQENPDAEYAWGICDGLSTPRPLAPLFDLAADLGGPLAELTRQPQPHRDELFRAVLDQIGTGDRLHVLVIEDVHWADEASLDLLRFLARRIRAGRVLILVTHRDEGVAHTAPWRIALGELASLRWTRRVHLEPLSAEAVGELAAGSDLDAAELFALTGGNPFYVSESIEAGGHGVPRSARDAVLARVARLGAEGADVLACASLMGSRVEPEVLMRATGCAPGVLDELVDSGLLVDDGAELRFRHELARLAIEARLPAHRRAALHAQVLSALCSTPDRPKDDARIAFHAEGAGDARAGLEHAHRAARRAAELGAHREATAQYERALRFVSVADPRTAAQLYNGLAAEAAFGDRWQVAADAGEQALRRWRELGDARSEGDTLRHYSLALKYLCLGDRSEVAGRLAVDTLEPLGDSVELAAAYATLATIHMVRSQRESATDLARRAQAVARRVGATPVVVDALNTEGCALSPAPGWTETTRRALELALSGNLPNEAGRAYNNLYGVLVDEFRFADAEPYFRAGLAYCDEHDLDSHAFCLRSNRTSVLMHRGQWDDALENCRRLLAEPSAAPLNRICSRAQTALIHARRGLSGFWSMLDEATALAAPTGQPQYIVPIQVYRAEAHLLAGHPAQARAEAERAVAFADGADPWMRGELNAWLARTGSPVRVPGDEAEPYELSRRGRAGEAAEAWDERQCPYHAGMAGLDGGREADLRAALTRFDQVGAVATGRLVRHRLRELGARSIPVGPRRATRAHPFGLTQRERQVLELICEHRTNPQIAQELFISIKTVDHHVSAVLAKLNTGNRESAADAARRLGLAKAE